MKNGAVKNPPERDGFRRFLRRDESAEWGTAATSVVNGGEKSPEMTGQMVFGLGRSSKRNIHLSSRQLAWSRGASLPTRVRRRQRSGVNTAGSGGRQDRTAAADRIRQRRPTSTRPDSSGADSQHDPRGSGPTRSDAQWHNRVSNRPKCLDSDPRSS